MLLFVGILLAAIPACTKDAKTCWVCTTLTSVSTPGYPAQSDSTKTTLCDKTQSDINDYIKNGHHQYTSGQSTITQIVLRCSKK